MSWMALATGLGALGSLWGGNKARKSASNKRRQDMQLAEQYGIHPLSAWGTAGTPMGDGGYGMMASGFDKAGQAAALKAKHDREDELMTQGVLHQMVLQEKDPQVKRALAEDILGYKMPASINQNTLTGTAKEIGKAVNHTRPGEYIGNLGNSLDVGIQGARQVFERGLNWLHTR